LNIHGRLHVTKTIVLRAACAAALIGCFSPLARPQAAVVPAPVSPLRDAYFGDLHLHTSYSFDAYIMGATRVDPDKAYRFAKGEVVDYLGQPVRRRTPLDFLAVTDHSENIGVINELEDPNSVVSQSDVIEPVAAFVAAIRGADGRPDLTRLAAVPKDVLARFRRFLQDRGKSRLPADLQAVSASAWQREIDLANSNYEPGKFTTFIAYEWSAQPDSNNLHRNVIFRGNTAPAPFTALDSTRPEDLWKWLETIARQGYEALAIPHNGNASNGSMYDWVDSNGRPLDLAYAQHRQVNEPLSEISQTKGSSEIHPLLAPTDEFANYEIMDFLAIERGHEGRVPGSYLRDALGRGLVFQHQLGVNPYKYGFVGGSDLHSGLDVSAQADYRGSIATVNIGGGTPDKQRAQSILQGEKSGTLLELKTTSGNLTGVWAQSNTRESIYDALRRRETFATTGTRLKFRFFAGWGFGRNLLQKKGWIATAYADGVSMGGDLPAKPTSAKAPWFAIWAVKDPDNGNLDRVQVVKVWEDGGQQQEKIFDVVWSGTRTPDRRTGSLPAVGNTVDLETGKYTNNIGATKLKAVWQDPQFNPYQEAAYYLRVLEIPTPRWSTLLAIRNGLPLPEDVPATQQQRGWSSPIWYTPQSKRARHRRSASS
jgi:hypothetical protein